MLYIHKFSINPSIFSELRADERKALPHLITATQLIATLYSKQENPKFLGANFYPHDVTKVEIEQAAGENPTILSPYTLVERDDAGRFIAVKYTEKYRSLLHRIAKHLLRASVIIEDSSFSLYLQTRAHALIDGEYDRADKVWLSGRLFRLNVMLGPIERYDDHLFFKKCAYRGWVSILDKELTEEANRVKQVMYRYHQPVRSSAQASILEKMRIRVDAPILFSGQIAKNMVVSNNLPNDVHLMEEYGSIITIFCRVILERFNHEILPLYKIIFPENFRRSYSLAIMERAALRHSYWHELAHPLGRYHDAEARLKEHFPIFDEIFATITGTKSAGTLFLKNFISLKELEASVVMLILQAYYSYLESSTRPGRIAYMKGYALMLNYMFENGALREIEGKLWPNFAKIYVCLENLSRLLEKILVSGRRYQAEQVVQQFVQPSVFERMIPKEKERRRLR